MNSVTLHTSRFAFNLNGNCHEDDSHITDKTGQETNSCLIIVNANWWVYSASQPK